MGKHRSPKQSTATASLQQFRSIIARLFSENWSGESVSQLKQWLMKFMPAAGMTGTVQWKDIRDSINVDLKLLEKLTLIFQEARDFSLILLMAQLFGELLSSKRASKVLVQQCGLTMAVLCQIRICCCLAPSGANGGRTGSPSRETVSPIGSAYSVPFNFVPPNQGNDLDKPGSSLGFNSLNSTTLQCTPQVAVALHQLACRVFPLDSRYNSKARATGAIVGTLIAAKSLTLDKKAMPVLLCTFRYYLNSSKNVKMLGQNGAVSLLNRLIGSIQPKQSKLIRLAADVFLALLKSASNCQRLVQAGGVSTLLTALENVQRHDARCRQIYVRRVLIRCLMSITQVKQGRNAIIQAGAIQSLFTMSRDLPARQDLDTLFLLAMGVIKQCAGPRRLPVSSLHSPYSFSVPTSNETSPTRSRRGTKQSNRSAPVPSPEAPVAAADCNPDPKILNNSDVEGDSDNESSKAPPGVIVTSHFSRRDSDDILENEQIRGIDDSDSDISPMENENYLASQNDPAAVAAALESDPVILSSHDMFFPELREFGQYVSSPQDPNNLDALNALLMSAVTVTDESSTVTATTGRTNFSFCQKRVTQVRKSAVNKASMMRRTSSETTELSITTNSDKNVPFLPLQLVGEHLNSSVSERNTASSSSSNNNSTTTPLNHYAANKDTLKYAKLQSGCKRVAIWNKISYPCLHGFSQCPNTEPLLSLPSLNIRRLVMADCERFLQKNPPDILNDVVYDLDDIVAVEQIRKSVRKPLPNETESPTVLGNDDLQRIGHCYGFSGLRFNSLFECGNLRKAIRVRENEYGKNYFKNSCQSFISI